MEPFEIWGDGKQERDFTYVEDIIEGSILAGEKIFDGTPINLGTGEKYTINEVVNMICEIIDWKPKNFKFDTSKPVGALSRALDNSSAKKLIGWEPRFTLKDGLKNTIRWYLQNHKQEGKVDETILLEHN